MTQIESEIADANQGRLEQKVRDRIESLSYLPTTVAVAMKFVELGKDPDAEPAEYAKVISSDSALSSKLLSLANSSWFGVRNKVTKPHTAVNLLGLGTVRTLAISYCLTGLHNELRLAPEESRMFWSASLCKAVAARQYALLFDRKIAEEAFTAGLFQDFAMPILYSVARERMSTLLHDVQISYQALLRKERDLFRLDHAEMGRVVAQKIDLPDVFVDGVAFHHNHDHLKEMLANKVLADAAHVASLFPHCLDAWNPQDAEQLSRFLAEHAAGNAAGPTALLDTIQKEYNLIQAYFGNSGKHRMKLADLLAQATREVADNTTRLVGAVHDLLQQAANTGQQVQQILKEHNELEEVVHSDRLTGALNREGLQARAAELLSQANRYGTSLAAVYFDIDHFKRINDTCGHAYGDAALQHVVATIQSCTRQTDLIARLGGDEFLLLLSDCGEADAACVVERILAKVSGEPVPNAQEPVAPITLSAGFLWIPPGALASGLEALASAADQLMYQAKRAGGNRMCKATQSASQN
jgi:diguanylate cyclase (GGDEF)-like protein